MTLAVVVERVVKLEINQPTSDFGALRTLMTHLEVNLIVQEGKKKVQDLKQSNVFKTIIKLL